MAIVKINALQIPPQAGEEIVKRFTARLGELSQVSGFEGFELLKPTGEAESRWFVYTRWADEAAYEAWRNSESFARGHAQAGSDQSAGQPGGHPGGGESGGHPGNGQGGGTQPVAMGSTLLEFEVTVSAGPSEA